jgi:hypothetical protein
MEISTTDIPTFFTHEPETHSPPIPPILPPKFQDIPTFFWNETKEPSQPQPITQTTKQSAFSTTHDLERSNISLWDIPQHKLSDEQQKVVDCVAAKNNVVVIAKAGAGKTTTSLQVAKEFYKQHKEKTLLLTYNANLKKETRGRILELRLDMEVEAHNYHALAMKYFCNGTANDTVIYAALQTPSIYPLPFGLIIIDESQDINPLYCQFIQHILKHCQSPPVLLMLGDPFQQIYRFSSADCKYMHEPDTFFRPYIHASPFQILHMNTSYRISHEMAAYVNENLSPLNLRFALSDKVWKEWGPILTAWWGDGIRANPERALDPDSVVYQKVKIHTPAGITEINKISKLLNTYGQEQVALLSKSTGTSTPINKVIEQLSRTDQENWTVLKGSSGSSNKQLLMQGKAVVSTIHQFKGLERDGIVVIGLDSFWEQKIGDSNIDEHLDLFNLFYVAATRAKKQLIIWNLTQKSYVTVRKTKDPKQYQFRPMECRVNNLIDYTCFDSMLSIPNQALTCPLIDFDQKLCDKYTFDEDVRMILGRTPGTMEDVSLVLATLIEVMIQIKCHCPLVVYTHAILRAKFKDDDHSIDELLPFLTQFYTKNQDTLTWEEAGQFALAKVTIESGLIHYWRQIKGQHWTSWIHTHIGMLDACVNNTKHMLFHLLEKTPNYTGHDDQDWQLLSSHIKFWQPVHLAAPFDWFTVKYEPYITGEIDLVLDNGMIVELKMSSEFQIDHALQAQLHAIMQQGIHTHTMSLRPIVMIPNLGEMYQVSLTLPQRHPQVPVSFDLFYRTLRRRLLKNTNDVDSLEHDYKLFLSGKKPKNIFSSHKYSSSSSPSFSSSSSSNENKVPDVPFSLPLSTSTYSINMPEENANILPPKRKYKKRTPDNTGSVLPSKKRKTKKT